MTIRELEQKSGLERANIRFYEKEKLLNPVRRENGYRDYSEEDLQTLRRICLFRRLQFSLEEIRSLQEGKEELSEALAIQLQRLERREWETERAREVCRSMQRDRAEFEGLDAEKYLAQLEKPLRQTDVEVRSSDHPEGKSALRDMRRETDRLPRLRAPWRRYWARMLDWNLYSLLWTVFLVFVLKVNLFRTELLLTVLGNAAPLGLMLLLEPAFLRGFGTTPGKAILGFRLEHEDGRKLTYLEGLSRTWHVALWGMGLGIPIYSLYRYFKSYGTCMSGELLKWEGLGEAELTLKDTRGRRTVLYVMAALLILAADIGLCFVLPAPPNRGEITVEEFAENYNFYAEYYQNDFWNKKLNEEGEWADASTDIVYQFPASFRWPDFIFEEEDGVLTGVTVRVELEGGGELMDTFQMQEQIAALAFAGASRNAPLSVWTAVRLGNRLAVQENGSLSFKEAGTEFYLHTEMKNYSQWSSEYLMGSSEDAYYLREFSMRKQTAAGG